MSSHNTSPLYLNLYRNMYCPSIGNAFMISVQVRFWAPFDMLSVKMFQECLVNMTDAFGPDFYDAGGLKKCFLESKAQIQKLREGWLDSSFPLSLSLFRNKIRIMKKKGRSPHISATLKERTNKLVLEHIRLQRVVHVIWNVVENWGEGRLEFTHFFSADAKC